MWFLAGYIAGIATWLITGIVANWMAYHDDF